MKKQKFVFMEHMADIKFKAYGVSLAEVFENAALAFSKYVSAHEKIKANKTKNIEVVGRDNESLLYTFLDELIYLLDAENFIVTEAKVKIEKNKLKAKLSGANIRNYRLNHVKAATYAEMYVRKVKYGSEEAWEAQVVLDV